MNLQEDIISVEKTWVKNIPSEPCPYSNLKVKRNTLISLAFHMANVLYTFLIAILIGICQPIVTGT